MLLFRRFITLQYFIQYFPDWYQVLVCYYCKVRRVCDTGYPCQFVIRLSLVDIGDRLTLPVAQRTNALIHGAVERT